MGSYDVGKAEAVQWIRENVPKEAVILDVGACDGKWRDLLPEYTMDAVEAFMPNIRANDLVIRYRNVFNEDIRWFDYLEYDFIIFGDVLEHMSAEDAQGVLKYADKHSKGYLVAVPYMYPQGEVYNNPYEVHIQDDLTEENVLERYPQLRPLIIMTDYYGYYVGGSYGG